jgi:diguanylate cyclase (GGDEF)-like protein
MGAVKTYCISNPELTHFLKREQRPDLTTYEADLAGTFRDILRRTVDLVPAETGAIFLDDPLLGRDGRDPGELVLIAFFGDDMQRSAGLRLPTTRGIVAHVYRTGRAYLSVRPAEDPLYGHGFEAGYRTVPQSLVCAPLKLEGDIVGALELSNHSSRGGFELHDLELLEVFAQTISASLTNAVDAQRSKELSKRDDLTGLYNDRYFHYSLSAIVTTMLAQGNDCGLIFLDLDHFKTINDVHGHLAGSRVLAEVGALLRQILPGHSVAARYGGDEFVVVLPDSGRQELFWVAETVRKNIESAEFLARPDPEDPVNYPALHISGVITCSLGLATLQGEVVPALGDAIADPLTVKGELIRLADTAMYRAKQRGRNLTVTAWAQRRRSAPAGAEQVKG